MNNFKIIGKLGEGTFSSVLKVKRISDDTFYALKKVKLGELSEKEKENALNEIRILASLEDENIIGYKEAFFDDTTQCLCVVMEYASKGDLQKKIELYKKNNIFINESEIWKMFYQIIQALDTLHQMKILHRDLKSANIFQTKDGFYKLGDMNVSKITKNQMAYTQTGTPYYASPEIWRDEPYDSKSDIWSFGCVLYEMAAQKPPFRAPDMKGLYKSVMKGTFDKLPPQYSNDLIQVISLCLAVQPRNRPSADQLIKNPITQRNLNDNNRQQRDQTRSQPNILIQTIKFPKHYRQLKDKLPLSRYHNRSQQELVSHMPQQRPRNNSYLPILEIQKQNHLVSSFSQKNDSVEQLDTLDPSSRFKLKIQLLREPKKHKNLINKVNQNDSRLQRIEQNDSRQQRIERLPSMIIKDRELNQKLVRGQKYLLDSIDNQYASVLAPKVKAQHYSLVIKQNSMVQKQSQLSEIQRSKNSIQREPEWWG